MVLPSRRPDPGSRHAPPRVAGDLAMSGRRQDWPRFARAEIRSFAAELDRGGWIYDGVDTKGHTIWSHPQASGPYKLPSTPSHFSVRRARRDVLRLLGRKPEGKRKGGPRKSPTAPDAQVEAARARHADAYAKTLARREQQRQAEASRQRSADRAAADERRRREIEDLMRPGGY